MILVLEDVLFVMLELVEVNHVLINVVPTLKVVLTIVMQDVAMDKIAMILQLVPIMVLLPLLKINVVIMVNRVMVISVIPH